MLIMNLVIKGHSTYTAKWWHKPFKTIKTFITKRLSFIQIVVTQGTPGRINEVDEMNK